MDIQSIKQRFGIIGNDPNLNRAIEVAVQVAATDLTVFINGESGTGKDVFPQIIHQNSSRKHGPYFAINCGAIPEGTIDSELFGHEKGSFTGAYEARKGYFEVANDGTLFLDEVGELPMATQARLLRVLENGEFIKVGSSKIQKTNVRVVAATNVNIPEAIEKGRFREDLYYRLNTVPIHIPPLRDRKDDIKLLFRKFASDFSEKNRIPPIQLTPEALIMLENYRWNGNIRQLKNVTDQISIIEKDRIVTPDVLLKYLPTQTSLPALFKDESRADSISERDLLYKVLFDMRKDIAELRKTVDDLTSNNIVQTTPMPTQQHISPMSYSPNNWNFNDEKNIIENDTTQDAEAEFVTDEFITNSLSLQEKEKDTILKALRKHNGKRKDAAKELGISERTLYRKIKEYDINI
ncbi:MAG: sigma-54 interaction domain-containing protein [Candidatus Limimorpha sp.]|nr:sigma-54-dependent Fis family transcriptional regulator [Bacteroidales bacterium]MCI7376907.1 sigma-54 dependent transcriptional regulator [Bacteroidales bacterium]MDD5978996.1 sigma-54 dependent transcriptional regulator [Bacteroidales bacterium]MDD7276704.1 sigma-54 dependent transcriptional regulator [Bacteroidales bacterium]MDY6074986.1 sigma-54 dependent transcriptional regulator [Bacteroidales bacterium]